MNCCLLDRWWGGFQASKQINKINKVIKRDQYALY